MANAANGMLLQEPKSGPTGYPLQPRSPIRILSGRRSKSPYYEDPVSEREEWWRSTLKDTPVPGSYELKDFVKEMHGKPVRTTYGFKNAGRKRNADPSRKGDKLMPGLYKHGTSIDELNKQHVTYSFKSCDRYHTPTALVGYMDKEFVKSQISPNTYYTGYKYVPKLPSKHPAFKSQERRFPTIYFKPREGPPPGEYKLSKDPILPKGPNVTSPFKSKTPRFVQPHVLKTPGPGTYCKTYQTPMPDTIKKMARNYGLFFTSGTYGDY
ncbi:protein STPG4-like [Pocillopora verrucosa]|uniref:protein STPG4-like n=1 Tax=Pocillopora verrucosa TaxID=203993 RepID=UPI0027977D92|nr:protein STPG4-like [Pocillopora verrucosa]